MEQPTAIFGTPFKVLCLEDSELDYDLICLYLDRDGFKYTATRVDDENSFTEALQSQSYDLILSDNNLGNFDGLSALKVAREVSPTIPFIFVSGTLGEDVAIESLRHGAVDYVTKQNIGRISAAVSRALFEARDKTARYNAEKALAATQERLELALAATSDGIWDWDMQQKKLYWSNRFKEMLGYPPDQQFSQHDWSEMIHPDDREKATSRIKGYLAKELPSYEVVYRLRHKDGSYRWLHSRGKASWDENGEPVRIAGGITDITDRKNAELALRESEERWRTLTEAMPQLVWIDRASDGWCEYLSSQWTEYSGEPVEKLLGFEWLKLLHPDDKERTSLAWEEAIAGRADYNIEYRIKRYDGEYRWFKVRGVPVRDENGTITIWYGTCTDIHDLKEAEAKAEAANLAKSEFLANMSHEIRTPMNAVLGLSNILAMTKDLPERFREIVSTLQLSAQSLLSLINDLLDISKIETNNIDLEHISFNFNDIVNEVFSVLAVKAYERKLELDYVNSQIGSQLFLGDPTRIRQVLMNLVSNGIKFTEIGSVSLHLEVSPHHDPHYQYVHIHVKDSGIGIPPHKVGMIFEKFTQADSSTTRKYGGTGLGLAISKNLAEIMGGGITVTSKLGEGTEFTLHLPLEVYTDNVVAIKPGTKVAVEETKTSLGHLLLVEDYAPNVMVATHVLQRLGYTCDIAKTGVEALIMLKSKRDKYNAILMDVQMPDMDGFEATKNIRQDEMEMNLGHIPIIAMTAHAFQSDKERCLETGMDGYIAKPFQLDELDEVLKHYCSPKRCCLQLNGSEVKICHADRKNQP